jgi:hypothetical protein
MTFSEYQAQDARERRRWWIALWVMAFAGPFIVVGVAKALAHEAEPTAAQPEGWSYPVSCCSLRDCRATEEGEVIETREGYKLISTGEVVAYGNSRIKPISEDGKIHVCQQGGNFDSGRILCLLVPPPST